MAKLSVIVPIYNVEEYLDWCLESLCNQTFADIEILCVNDGTKDRSREIASRFADADSRFVILDKPNGGLSSARNMGIRAATAPFVCFVDSDDRMTLDACERIVATFNKTDADIVTFGANCYPESAGNNWLVEHLSPRDVEYVNFSTDILFKEMSRPFAWRTACKKSFLIENNLFFDETLLFGEDQLFHFAIYPRAEKTVFISDKLYDYRVSREGSLMHQIEQNPERKMAEHINIIKYIFDDWNSGFFLKQYPAEMIGWTAEFALYGIANQEAAVRDKLLSDLRKVWFCYFLKDEIANLKLPKASKHMIKEALKEQDSFVGKKGKLLRYFFYVEQYGIRVSAGKLVNRLMKR